jgi:hypothetical protein
MPGEDYQQNQGTSSARNDPISNRLDSLEGKSGHTLDRRQTVTHKFTTTAEENFTHSLGKIPTGALIANMNLHARIKFNMTKTTAQRMYATSDTANVTVIFLLF